MEFLEYMTHYWIVTIREVDDISHEIFRTQNGAWDHVKKHALNNENLQDYDEIKNKTLEICDEAKRRGEFFFDDYKEIKYLVEQAEFYNV